MPRGLGFRVRGFRIYGLMAPTLLLLNKNIRCSLGLYMATYLGEYDRAYEGDARGLDYSSYTKVLIKGKLKP